MEMRRIIQLGVLFTVSLSFGQFSTALMKAMKAKKLTPTIIQVQGTEAEMENGKSEIK